MNSVYKLLIQLIGQDKGASRELKETEREVNALGKASTAMGAAMSLAAVAGIAYMGKQAVEAAWEMGKLGAAAIQQADALDELARQAGGTGDAIVAAIKRASGNTVAETDIILAANRGVLLGLGAQADEWGKLTEVARFRAKAMGITTTQALNDITTAIGRESKMIADNLGIIWDMDAIMGDYARTLGKTAKELTQVERNQALLTDTIRIGQAQIHAAGGIARTAADDMAALETAIADLKTEWAKLISGPVAETATGITYLINRLTGELPVALVQAAFDAQAAGGSFLAMADAANKAKLAMSATRFGVDMESVILDGEELIGILKAMGATTPDIVRVADALGIELAAGWAEAMTSADGFMVSIGHLPGYLAQANTALIGHGAILGTVASMYRAIAGMPQAVLDLDPRAAEAWQHLQDTRDAAEREWIENSMDRLHGFDDANKETARSVGKTWKDAYDEIRSAVESALQPTQVTALDMGLSELGLYVDKWDESARRLDAIAEGGLGALEAHPDWAAALKIPDNVLAAGEEALKSWARQTSAAVRDLTRPDLLNIDAAVAAVEQYFADMAARELSIDIITQALIDKGVVSGGADAQKRVAQALGLDQTTVGETAGTEIFQGMIDKFAEKSAASEFAGYLSKDVINQAVQLRGAGYELWITTEVGILDAMEEGNYVQRWINLLLPALVAAMGTQGQWSGEGEP